MQQKEHSIELDEIAAELAVRVDAGPLSEDESRSLEEWLSRSSRHRGAYERARAALLLMDGEFIQHAEANYSSPLISRRQALCGGVGTAIAAAASIAIIVMRDHPVVTRYAAPKGQIRVVSLSDNSLITLDASSEILVTFSAAKRQVALIAGRALFDVAKDMSRPFLVNVSETSVKAVGTSFSIRNIESLPVEVLVREGIVDVGGPSVEHPMRVGANMRVVAQSGRGNPFSVTTVAASTIANELSWREGYLAFDDVSIRVAIQLFAQHNAQRIVISDPTIAEITITGLFASHDSTAFAQAAATSLGLKMETVGDEIRLTR